MAPARTVSTTVPTSVSGRVFSETARSSARTLALDADAGALLAVMSNWNGTIIGPGHSVHQNRIYSLKIHCDESYPDGPPTISFLTRINLPCVNQQTGKVGADERTRTSFAPSDRLWACLAQVESSLLPVLAHWKRQYTLETVLIELRK